MRISSAQFFQLNVSQMNDQQTQLRSCINRSRVA